MSTEIDLGGLTLTTTEGELELPEPFDRVLHTAADQPSTDSMPALVDPAADHVDEALVERRRDVDEKHHRVADFLQESGYDAVVLGRADSVSWFTSGGDLAQTLLSAGSAVLVYVNRHCRAVVTDNVQSARAFEEELAGLGFQLKERPWFEDPVRVIDELAHSKTIATDCGLRTWPVECEKVRALRRPMTELERQRLRELGRTLTLAVEATCRNFEPGETEADVAGHLAHRLIREGVVPVDLRVAGDDRLDRYRQPTFKAAPIRRRATISAVGRRHGLCAGVTRTVCFGPVDPYFRDCHSLATMVDATCIFFSRPGETVEGAFRRAKRIYQKFSRADEWTLDYQGFAIGYNPREMLLTPDNPRLLEPGMALCWSPSVGSARSEDTVVIDTRGFEVVTEAQRWPKVEVMVKGFPIPRPGILER